MVVIEIDPDKKSWVTPVKDNGEGGFMQKGLAIYFKVEHIETVEELLKVLQNIKDNNKQESEVDDGTF